MDGDGDGDGVARRRALQQAFGDSSESGGEEADAEAASGQEDDASEDDQGHGWEKVRGIEGLWLCRLFLSEPQQAAFLSAIEREGWFTEGFHNQAMRFGDLPEWATELSRLVRKAVCCAELSLNGVNDMAAVNQCAEEPSPLPFDLLWREPLFDQLITNVYQPDEGICAHVDLMRFEDGIAIVSLESACVMHFSRTEQAQNAIGEERAEDHPCSTRVPVFLNPGSLILMSGEARYVWRHEINRKPGFQVWEGKELRQERRTSVTLRKLRPSPGKS